MQDARDDLLVKHEALLAGIDVDICRIRSTECTKHGWARYSVVLNPISKTQGLKPTITSFRNAPSVLRIDHAMQNIWTLPQAAQPSYYGRKSRAGCRLGRVIWSTYSVRFDSLPVLMICMYSVFGSNCRSFSRHPFLRVDSQHTQRVCYALCWAIRIDLCKAYWNLYLFLFVRDKCPSSLYLVIELVKIW